MRRCEAPEGLHPLAAARLSLQHPFNYHSDNGNITDSGALFCRDQKCCVFRPSVAVFPSVLSLAVSLLFSSSPRLHFHCHIHLVGLFHPHLPVCLFLCLSVFFRPSLLPPSTHIM